MAIKLALVSVNYATIMATVILLKGSIDGQAFSNYDDNNDS